MKELTRQVFARKIGWTDALPVNGGEKLWVTNRGGPEGSSGDIHVIVECLFESSYQANPTGWKRLFSKDFTATERQVGGCDMTEGNIFLNKTHYIPQGVKYVRLRAHAVDNALDLTVNPGIMHVIYPDALKAPAMRKLAPLVQDVLPDESFENQSHQPSASEAVLGDTPGLVTGPKTLGYGIGGLPQYLFPGWWATEIGASPDFDLHTSNSAFSNEFFEAVAGQAGHRPPKGTGAARQISGTAVSMDTYGRNDANAVYPTLMNPSNGQGFAAFFWFKPYARQTTSGAGTDIIHTIFQDTDRGATRHINIEINQLGALTLRLRDGAHALDTEIISATPTVNNYSTNWKEDTWYAYGISSTSTAHDIWVHNGNDQNDESLTDATPTHKSVTPPAFDYEDVTNFRYGGICGGPEEQTVGAISNVMIWPHNIDWSGTTIRNGMRSNQAGSNDRMMLPVGWDGLSADQASVIPCLFFPDGDPFHNLAQGGATGWFLEAGRRGRKVPGPAQELGWKYAVT